MSRKLRLDFVLLFFIYMGKLQGDNPLKQSHVLYNLTRLNCLKVQNYDTFTLKIARFFLLILCNL